jgi:adenylate cyclase class 2
MQIEYETQVLDIDVKEIVSKLRKLGGKETAEANQKRWIFDMVPCTVESTGEWIRLRQVGDHKPTITYKNKSGKGSADTKELEMEVEDFEKAEKILSKLPFKGKYYQENKRHKFEIDDIEFTLDTWPQIPTYLEIEAKSEDGLERGLKLLDLSGKDVGHIGSLSIYKRYGIDLHSIEELKF